MVWTSTINSPTKKAEEGSQRYRRPIPSPAFVVGWNMSATHSTLISEACKMESEVM
jgi:hypothetical protein